MCGILCLLSLNNKAPELGNELQNILRNRGPDAEAIFHACNNLITFYGFVLWQQGEKVFSQPAISEKFLLLLNGDIFNADKPVLMSDTEWLLLELEKCDTENAIIKLILNLKGPYSIIFYSTYLKSLYFARDPLGRNSLVLEHDLNGIKITSTSNLCTKNNICVELPPVGIYKISLDYNDVDSVLNFKCGELFPWKDISQTQKENVENIFRIPLRENLRIERIFVSSLETQNVKDYFSFYDLVENVDMEPIKQMQRILEHDKVTTCVENVLHLLELSLRDRILNTPKFCINCIKEQRICNHSKIGILFSGGLDCSILARLAHEFCNKSESIDLINVAFERINSKNGENIDWNTPDRITCIKSYEELKLLLPERKWNLIEVNVTRIELSLCLSTVIKHLIYPLNTVLDESLGASFWFASRGEGLLKNKLYQTTCRVILIGSGADEMFGGYTRHKNAFTRTEGDLFSKIKAVDEELRMDWDRIAFRNLGRDDRVISDNCKTARSPYIEENLVGFINNLKSEQKCCFKLPPGVGDKLLLRLCGYKLGLRYSSTLQKRAIQFGSKIADRKQNGMEVSKYLVHI